MPLNLVFTGTTMAPAPWMARAATIHCQQFGGAVRKPTSQFFCQRGFIYRFRRGGFKEQNPLIRWNAQYSGPGIGMRLFDLAVNFNGLMLRLSADPFMGFLLPGWVLPENLGLS